MQIIYQEINPELLEKMEAHYGDWVKQYIHFEEGSYSLAAMHEDIPAGFISAFTLCLAAPLTKAHDAYIDVIEVDNKYQRQGIASGLIERTENWARGQGFTQIRAWSSQDKIEAISMWRSLQYCMCPAKIWVEWCKEIVDGYYVAKQLNPINPYPHIAKLIKEDIYSNSEGRVRDLHLIRAKNGVYVFRCTYNGIPAVVKYLENESDKREIKNYHILIENDIPTIKIHALGDASIVMEDISLSTEWRLGIEEDMKDAAVAEGLAKWYFKFHEAGMAVSGIDALYCEYDSITDVKIENLCMKLPEASDTFRYILTHYNKLREMISKLSFTLTYNDFYWTNFIVRKDKQEALMFDYNLLGKGCRYSDFRNVSSLSNDAYKAFMDEYNQLYLSKHGNNRTKEDQEEKRIDNVVSCLFSLITAYEMDNFPDWEGEARAEALNGTLFSNAKILFENRND